MDEQYHEGESPASSDSEAFYSDYDEGERRHRFVRDTIIATLVVVLAGSLIAGLVVLIIFGNRGPRVPDLIGMSYQEARSEASSAKYGIEIDSMQDSTGDCEDLEVTEQYPEAGSEVEEGEVITVRLKGLYESEQVLGEGSSDSQLPETAEKPVEDVAGDDTVSQTGAGRVVCLDPGHSTGCPSVEIDPATGLNVADNGGASGELTANWEVAVKTKEKLEQQGYTVKMTKSRPDMYASLRTRADIGNTCNIMIRIHFDPNLHALLRPAEGQYKQNGNSIKYVDPGVAAGSAALANTMFPYLQSAGIADIRDDCGGTSANTGSAFVGSVLSTVPVVLIENDPAMVKNNSAGQDRVAAAIADGVRAYFAGL